jgi:hypothetical protein
LVFELLEGVGDALAEGWEDGFGFFDCSALGRRSDMASKFLRHKMKCRE